MPASSVRRVAVSADGSLEEVGDGLYAYLQRDGGWGWSNAGLISCDADSVLVDTLFDRRLTEDMLNTMRAALPAAAKIGTLVNTHANGDHCYGNQLVSGARIIASERAAAEMAELPPQAMAALLEQAPQMGEVGAFFLRCFGDFDFRGLELKLPDQTFSRQMTLSVAGKQLELLEVGPAHTRGDVMVHAPAQRVLFTGDILFSGSHPIVWAGPVSNWIVACERILALEPEVLVPGHGPLATVAQVRELKAYFEYLYAQARAHHDAGDSALQAARALSLDRWAAWGNRERLVVNIASIYAELDAQRAAVEPLTAFQQMASFASEEQLGR